MSDRSDFWKMVDRTKPSKLRVFAESELRDCEDYFLEIQSDPTLPANEIITASERLALLRSEIDLRHSDAKHRKTQRLARWAIAFGMVSMAAANPHRFRSVKPGFHRANLKRFPYHFIYRDLSQRIRVTLVRHHRRHPEFGIERE